MPIVLCGMADELLPESITTAEALKRADIRHELQIFEDMPHGFVQVDLFGETVELLQCWIAASRPQTTAPCSSAI